MQRKRLLAGIVIVLLGLAACGSSGSTSSSGTGSAGGTAAGKSKTGVRGHIYRLTLSGKAETPPGAPNGGGAATIALHSNLTACWRFSHMHGFTDATASHIHRGSAGTAGPIVVPLSTSPKLHHKGCVHTTAATIKAIEHDPAGYYVNVHSKQFPGGAVRAQL